MVGSSWTGSVQGGDDDLDARIASSMGEETSEGRQSVTDMIVSRVIETVRAGVIVTSEALGEMTAEFNTRYDRLDQRLTDLAGLVSRQPGPASDAGDEFDADLGGAHFERPRPDDHRLDDRRLDDHRLDDIDARLARLEELLQREPVAAAPAADLAPVWEMLEALRHEVMARPAATAAPDLDDVRAAMGDIRDALLQLQQSAPAALAPAPEWAVPTAGFSAVDDVLFRIDGVEAALRSGLADLADAVVGERGDRAATAAPDLTPLVDAVGSRLAELRGTLQGRLDDVEAAVRSGSNGTARPYDDNATISAATTDALTDAVTDAVRQAMASNLTGMAQSSDSGSGPDLVAAIEQAAAQMRAAIDALDERSGIDTHTMTELIGAQLSDLHRGVALSQEAAAVHHDAIASRLASLQAEAATTPDLLASVREAVLDARGDALARHIELQSTLQAIAGDLVAQLGELRSMVGEGTDRGDLEQAITASIAEVRSALDAVQTAGADQTRDLHHAIGTSTDRIAGGQADLRHAIEASADTRAIEDAIAATNDRIAELHNALDAVQTAGADQTRDLHHAIGTSTDRIAGDQADLRHAIEASADTRAIEDAIAATNDRIAELRAALEGVQDVTLTNTRELQAGIAAATDRISGDVDRLYQATENGPDLTPVTGALAELRGAVDDVFHAGGGNARGLHDAITSATDRLAAELGQVRAAAQAGPDLSPVTGPLSELLSGIDSIHEAGTANTRDLRETIAAATDRIAEIRTAVAAGRDEAGSNARELREALGTATDRVAGQLDRLEEAIERGPDVTALTTAMDEVRSMVAAANDAIERTAAGPALADLREAIAAVRGTVTLAQQGLAADLASTRDIVRTGIDEMSSGLTIRSDATTAAIERITEQLSGFEHTAEHALEWSDETGARLASIERELGAGREQLEIVPQRLAELADRAGRTSDDISAIAHWTSVHDTPERLEDLAGSLDSKLASLAEVVPSLQGALLDTRAAFERANEGLIGSLDGLRSHLTANGGFTAQSERIRELRTAVEELARHVAETEAAAGGREGVGAASGTIAQLQSTVEGLLTRFEDRTNTLTTRSASLESLVEQSVRQLESQVKDVLTGLGANDRLVRGRFEQLETTLSALRGDVTQIRSLRAEMESLGGAVDDLRNRVAR